MNLDWTNASIVERLGWTLIHSLWIGAAAGLLHAGLMAALRRRSAQARYAGGCAALGLFMAGVVAAFVVQAGERPVKDRPAEVVRAGPALMAREMPAVSGDGAGSEAIPAAAEREPSRLWRTVKAPARVRGWAAAAPAELAAAAAPAREVSWNERLARVLTPALPWVVLGWGCGVGLLGLWQFRGWVGLVRLRRYARPAEAGLEQRAQWLARRLNIQRAVEVVESALVRVPMVMGWARPVILLPAGLALGLTPAQLEAILAHELSHIRRHDYVVNLLQTLVETLLFYHPATWMIARRIRREREHCCDDAVVALGADGRRYAESLLEVARQSALRGAGLGVAATGKRSELRRRIMRLVGEEGAARGRQWPVVVAAAVVGLGVILAAACLRSAATPATPATPANESGWSQPVDGLALMLKTDIVRYEVGDKIRVDFVLKNTTEREIEVFNRAASGDSWYCDFESIKDAEGRDIAHGSRPPEGAAEDRVIKLEPGKQTELHVDLSRWMLAGPGHPETSIGGEPRTLVLRGVFFTPKGFDFDRKIWAGLVISNPLKIEIAAASGPTTAPTSRTGFGSGGTASDADIAALKAPRGPLVAALVVETIEGTDTLQFQLRNRSDQPVKVCSTPWPTSSRDLGYAVYAVHFMPGITKDTLPTEEWRKRVVTLGPGEHVNWRVEYPAMTPGVHAKFDADYVVFPDVAKEIGIWGGSVAAPTADVRVDQAGQITVKPWKPAAVWPATEDASARVASQMERWIDELSRQLAGLAEGIKPEIHLNPNPAGKLVSANCQVAFNCAFNALGDWPLKFTGDQPALALRVSAGRAGDWNDVALAADAAHIAWDGKAIFREYRLPGTDWIIMLAAQSNDAALAQRANGIFDTAYNQLAKAAGEIATTQKAAVPLERTVDLAEKLTTDVAADAFVAYRIERVNGGLVSTALLIGSAEKEGAVSVRTVEMERIPRWDVSELLDVHEGRFIFRNKGTQKGLIMDLGTGQAREVPADDPALVRRAPSNDGVRGSRELVWEQEPLNSGGAGLLTRRLVVHNIETGQTERIWEHVSYSAPRDNVADRKPPAVWIDDDHVLTLHTVAGAHGFGSQEIVVINTQTKKVTGLGRLPSGYIDLLPPLGKGKDVAVILNAGIGLGNGVSATRVYGVAAAEALAGRGKLEERAVSYGAFTLSGPITPYQRSTLHVGTLAAGETTLASNVEASFSPDGTRVVWRTMPADPNEGGSALFYYDSAEKRIHKVATAPFFSFEIWTTREQLKPAAARAPATQKAAVPLVMTVDLAALPELAAKLTKEVGGEWELDAYNALPATERILRGRIRDAQGKSLVEYDVFPFGLETFQRRLGGSFKSANPDWLWVLGSTDLITVMESRDGSKPEPAETEKLVKALGLKRAERKTPAATTGPGARAGGEWGAVVEGLRMRVAAFEEGQAGMPLMVQVENTSDSAVNYTRMGMTAEIVAYPGEGRQMRLVTLERLPVYQEDGALEAGKVLSWVVRLERAGEPHQQPVGTPTKLPVVKAGEVLPLKVRLAVGGAGAEGGPLRYVESGIVRVKAAQTLGEELAADAIPEKWSATTNLMYQERGMFAGDTWMSVDGRGRAVVIQSKYGRLDKEMPAGIYEGVLSAEDLGAMAGALRRIEYKERRQVPPLTDQRETTVVVSVGGSAARSRWEEPAERQEPALAELRGVMRKVMVGVVKRAGEALWGEAVQGISLRLRPANSTWNVDARVLAAGKPSPDHPLHAERTPVLTLDVRNQGSLSPWVGAAQAGFRMEIDGKQYRYAGVINMESARLEPGQSITDIGFPIGGLWQPELPKLWPGKHTVRAVLLVDGGQSFLVYSNAATVEVLADNPATTRAASRPTSRAAGDQAEIPLPVGRETSGGLRIERYQADKAKEGLLAIGAYDRNEMPPLPSLYDWALSGRVSRGGLELIGRLSDQSTPLKIMRYGLKGHELTIEVALSPEKQAGSSYIWGELPKDLKPGWYHVTLTAYECIEKDGQLVPAPKTAIRAFYQLESYYHVPQDAAAQRAWREQDKRVEQTMEQLHERLKFLESDLPRNQAGNEPRIYANVEKTTAGNLIRDGIQLQHNWDLGVPRRLPPEAAAGMAVFVWALRDDPYADQYVPVRGPVRWDGKAETRHYALEPGEFGWKVAVTVEGNRPELVKKVNGIIDDALTQLAKALTAIPEAGASGPAVTMPGAKAGGEGVPAETDVDKLVAAIKMPEGWRVERREGEVTPYGLVAGRGMELVFMPAGAEGKRALPVMWVMAEDYSGALPPPHPGLPPQMPAGRAREWGRWNGGRVYIPDNDWTKAADEGWNGAVREIERALKATGGIPAGQPPTEQGQVR